MTKIIIRYFAAAAEAAGRDEEHWDLDSTNSIEALRQQLGERYGEAMQKVLRSGSFLVDGTVRRDGPVIDQDRSNRTTMVDVLPPFAGG